MQPENSRQTQKMADNASSSSPQKPLQPSSTAIDPNPPNPNLPSAQIPPSPSMDLPSISSPQLPQLTPSGALSVQPQRQNSSSSASSFQIQPNNLQRSGTMPMLSQIQPQAWMYGGGGQMNFGAAAAAAAAAGMARSGMIGQTAAQLNLQAQILGQTRQKAGLVQGMQLRPSNSSGQGMQGMQAMGMMGSLANSQIRANGAFAYGQRFNQQGQARQQQLLPQMALTSPQKLQGQSLPRGSSFATMNPQFAGLTQNGQSALQNSLSQQQWLKQMQSTMSTPASPSHSLQQQQQQQQRQQQAFLAQLPSPQAHQKSMGLTQLGSPRQHQAQQQHLINQQQLQQLQQFQQQHQQQQQSPRRQTSAVQKSLSLTGSQPDTPASVTTTTVEGSSQEAEASNQLLGKRKIQDLVSQVDSLGKLDPGVEDLLLEIADDFIDSVTAFACSLAKHRKSSTLESKDLLLHLEKNWQLSIPGFTRDGQNHQKESLPSDAHRTRLEMIRTLIKPQQLGRDVCEEETAKQAGITSAMDHQIRPSSSSEQFLAAATSQMLQKVPRF